MGSFLDIAGAFDSTSFAAITNACTKFGIDQTIVKWIDYMLKSRIVEFSLDDFSIAVQVVKGCPQGAVLSPLLWLLVINDLLTNLNNSGFTSQSYADDLVITISGKSLVTISELMQVALSIVEFWCRGKGLHVNPTKTDIVIFTRRRIIEGFSSPMLFGKRINKSDHVKHLGVVLDSKLLWKQHVDLKIQKAFAIFWQCRRAFGKTWGLAPNMLHFIYKSLVLPMLCYASIVWWPTVNSSSTINKLNGLQNTACRAITGAMLSTPLLAMETLLSLPTLHSLILNKACSAAFRLRCIGAWNTFGAEVGHRKILGIYKSSITELDMVNDRLLPTYQFANSFTISYPSRELWASEDFI